MIYFLGIRFRFDGFNKVWESKQIGEIAEVVGGGTPKTEIVDYWDGEIKWFTPSEIGKTKYVFDSDRHITEKGLKNSSAKLLPKNALLLSSRATVGEISIALTECSTNQGFQSLITKSNVDNDFIYYLISTIKNEFLRRSSGSTFLEINKNEIKRMPINIPELSEQKKISNLFSAIDNKIEMLEKKCEYYQDFKKYLMQRIFSSSDDKLRFVDFNNSSWKDYKFKDLGTVKSGVGFSNKYQGHLDLDYNFYKVSDMNLKGNEKVMTRSNNTIDDNLLKDIGVKLIENPSIIFAKVGEAIFLNRKRIAKQPFLIDNNMMAFSPNENVDLEFMYYLATSINFGKYAQTGALPSYNASDIYSIKCKIPPIEEQKRIGKLLSLADNKIDFCSNQLNKTQEFKKGLLQQMFVVRINWRCNFKLVKSPSFNKHLLILKNKIIFIIIK